jgi:hypothetical protein
MLKKPRSSQEFTEKLQSSLEELSLQEEISNPGPSIIRMGNSRDRGRRDLIIESTQVVLSNSDGEPAVIIHHMGRPLWASPRYRPAASSVDSAMSNVNLGDSLPATPESSPALASRKRLSNG